MAAEEKKEPDLDPLEIPAYLEPKDEDAAQIEATKLLPLPANNAKAIATTLKKLGLKRVTAQQITQLSNLGIMFPPATIMRLATGSSVVTEVGLTHAFTEVMRIFEKSNDKAKLKIVSQIGFLGKTLTANHKQIQDNARKNLPRTVDAAGTSPKSHRFPVMQVVVQNSSGQTIVKTAEKTIDLPAEPSGTK